MHDLKLRITKSGITRKKLAARCEVAYGTLNLYLNDFLPMPDHVKERIEKILEEENGSNNQN